MREWTRTTLVSTALALLLGGCTSANTESPRELKQPTINALPQSTTSQATGSSKRVYGTQAATTEDAEKVILRKPAEPIRGIYVSSHVARSKRMDELIDLLDKTELNAVVVDINSGMTLTALPKSAHPDSFTIAKTRSAGQIAGLVKKLKQHRIYAIARIVTFKNPELARAVPAWSIKRKNGRTWTDKGGIPWIDPYRQEAWEYPLKLAEHAARIGFDEVQFDYVRFPENEKKVDQEVAYANPKRWSKSDVIGKFLHRASVRMHKVGVRVSADVFGLVGSSNDDMGIGQNWATIAKEIDVVSPMVYPSHYSDGIWGVKHPDLSPRPIITHALMDISRRNERLKAKGIDTAKVRPWLQSFSATWLHPHQTYGTKQVREQISAAAQAGYPSYLLWNSASRYPPLNR